VAVGSGVSILRGVGVKVAVGVEVGMASAVRVDAALAVCTINVPIVFGSVVGTAGAATAGTHAMTSTSAMNHIRYFVLGVAIIPLAFPNHPPDLLLDISNHQTSGIWIIFQQ